MENAKIPKKVKATSKNSTKKPKKKIKEYSGNY